MIIVGAGGLGREVEELAWSDVANGQDWMIAGFLDTRPGVLDKYATRFDVIGDPRTYTPRAKDIFIAAIGDTRLKQELVGSLLHKGAKFVSLRTDVHMGSRCQWGASVFGQRAKLSLDVTVGDYAYVGAETIVGHDTRIEDYAHIGARCFIAGRAKIGRYVTIHPMATITMDVEIGEGAVVGAGAVVFANVMPHTTVVGNPARKFEFHGR